jgi:hypothetical protein
MGVDTAGVRELNSPHFEMRVANVFQPPEFQEFLHIGQQQCCVVDVIMPCMPLIILFVLTHFFTFVSYHLGRFFNTFSQLNSCLETYFLFQKCSKTHVQRCIFSKIFRGKTPGPPTNGRPRLTRGGMGDGGEGGEGKVKGKGKGKGKGRGKGKGLGIPQNLYVAYAHAELRILSSKDFSTNL